MAAAYGMMMGIYKRAEASAGKVKGIIKRPGDSSETEEEKYII